MAALLAQLRAFHDGLEPARRRVLWVAAAAAVAAVVGVGVWASSPKYVVLTRASDGDEASAVTSALAEAGLPYRVDADGLTVRVPALQEVDARRAAAGDGGIVGLEGLEQIDPWVTPFQEQLHRQRMLQGELVRTIEGIAGIRSATVQLDLPEPSAFLRDVTHPTAAVTLRPDEGGILDARTARSVAELVSHAVSGMGAEDVTVVDASSGRTLWGAAQDAAEAALAVDAAHREAALAASVRTALRTLLGRDDAAAVTVRVELESAAVQQTVNAVDPASAVAATERIETEVDTRGSSVAGGAPGTDANLAERASTAESGSRTRETTQTSYQFTTTTTTTTTPAGGIRRLSASVIIDSAVFGAAAGAEQDAALREQIQRAVRAALGASDTRGDEVVVSFLPFVTASAATAPGAVQAVAPTAMSDETLIGALVLLVIAALVARPLYRALRPAPPPVVAPEAAPVEPVAPVVEEPVADEPAPLDFTARLRGHLDRLETHQPRDVSDLVRRESEHSAEVVRRWLQSS